MENSNPVYHNYQLSFRGKGGSLFGILIVNSILTGLTLGLYYPWAKARQLQYMYNSSFLNDSPFTFHGTGKEMFKGFIKSFLILIALYGIFFLLSYLGLPLIGSLFFILSICTIYPLALHGSYRYRMSRTSFKGIRFGYRGQLKELIGLFYKSVFLTFITFGIYGSWMTINLRNYILSNVRYGSLKFEYEGNGGEYFVLNLKGYILTLLTMGIYIFWWYKEIFEYYVNHLKLKNDKHEIFFSSVADAGAVFRLMFVNVLIIVFTFGMGYAWAITRTMKFIFNNIAIRGYVSLDEVIQTEESYIDATGDDLLDMMDMTFSI